jgi:hypothetical protein
LEFPDLKRREITDQDRLGTDGMKALEREETVARFAQTDPSLERVVSYIADTEGATLSDTESWVKSLPPDAQRVLTGNNTRTLFAAPFFIYINDHCTRQARDKHRENSKREMRFRTGGSDGGVSASHPGALVPNPALSERQRLEFYLWDLCGYLILRKAFLPQAEKAIWLAGFLVHFPHKLFLQRQAREKRRENLLQDPFSYRQLRLWSGLMPRVRENGSFEPFLHKCDLFTKTGSGQTQGNHSKKTTVVSGKLDPTEGAYEETV